eukprot:207901-Chlamydomonas_euryale.AAC.4
MGENAWEVGERQHAWGGGGEGEHAVHAPMRARMHACKGACAFMHTPCKRPCTLHPNPGLGPLHLQLLKQHQEIDSSLWRRREATQRACRRRRDGRSGFDRRRGRRRFTTHDDYAWADAPAGGSLGAAVDPAAAAACWAIAGDLAEAARPQTHRSALSAPIPVPRIASSPLFLLFPKRLSFSLPIFGPPLFLFPGRSGTEDSRLPPARRLPV